MDADKVGVARLPEPIVGGRCGVRLPGTWAIGWLSRRGQIWPRQSHAQRAARERGGGRRRFRGREHGEHPPFDAAGHRGSYSGGSRASSARQAACNGGRWSRTISHTSGAEMIRYSWRSTLPMAATFCHGISGCRAFKSSGNLRLASEMISIPRSTIHCCSRSSLNASSGVFPTLPWIRSVASMVSVS